jgi:hypothetical protein
MRNRSPANSNVERLRLAIDCMPVATRQAMLAGVRANQRIIVGAYVDGRGGICPMLAAHRAGARTDFLAFARSWDRFTRANRKARVASTRELSILIAQLQASLMSADGSCFDEAIDAHRALVRASRRARAAKTRRKRGTRLPYAADPAGEIVARRLRGPGASTRAQRPAHSFTAREPLLAR